MPPANAINGCLERSNRHAEALRATRRGLTFADGDDDPLVARLRRAERDLAAHESAELSVRLPALLSMAERCVGAPLWAYAFGVRRNGIHGWAIWQFGRRTRTGGPGSPSFLSACIGGRPEACLR